MKGREVFETGYLSAVGQPYRPSNGTEGEFFHERWCADCKRDAAFQQDPDFGDSCPLICNAMAFNIGHPEYPTEWIYGEDGQPECKAFEDKHAADGSYRCETTPDLFG